MTEQQGTTQTVNAIEFIFTTAELLAKEIAGDGLQWSDSFKVFNSPEFRKELDEVKAGYRAIPSELRDLSVVEGLDLAGHALEGAKRVIAGLGRAA